MFRVLFWLISGMLVIVIALGGCHRSQQEEAQVHPTPTQAVAPEYIPAPEPPSWEPPETRKPRSVEMIVSESKTVLQNVHFDYDKYALKVEAKKILVKIAEWLVKNPNVKLVIEGHCDERGSNEYNLALGEKRARSCESYLVALGVDSSNLSMISYGEERPLDPGHNEIAWGKNRRCHFKLVFK